MKITFCFLFMWMFFVEHAYASNDSTIDKLANFPNKIFARITNKSSHLDDQLTRKTEKYLEQMAGQERLMRNKLFKTDSNAAKRLFDNSQAKYAQYLRHLRDSSTNSDNASHGEYLANVDSTKCALSFLQQYQSGNANSKINQQLASASSQLNRLQSRFQQTDEIKAFIRERQQFLKDYVSKYAQNLGLDKYLNAYKQQMYYYTEQVREYREAFNSSDKVMQKALIILNKLPVFQNFLKTHGQLASLFGISPDYGSADGIVGLQTRDQVQNLLQGQIGGNGSGGMAAFQSGLSSAHAQLDQFKDKISQLGSGSGDMTMPDFKKNPEKTHSFLKRIEVGTNLQTTRTSYLFPTTTDIGLSIGYKLNGNSTVGIGASYKLGWGRGINHVAITSEGMSLRSFLDFKVKGSWFATGGLEYNYQQPFTSFQNIRSLNAWTASGLIGISKMVSVPGKIIKKTKLQLLWDFLSYRQIPRTQAFVFRIGYNF